MTTDQRCQNAIQTSTESVVKIINDLTNLKIQTDEFDITLKKLIDEFAADNITLKEQIDELAARQITLKKQNITLKKQFDELAERVSNIENLLNIRPKCLQCKINKATDTVCMTCGRRFYNPAP